MTLAISEMDEMENVQVPVDRLPGNILLTPLLSLPRHSNPAKDIVRPLTPPPIIFKHSKFVLSQYYDDTLELARHVRVSLSSSNGVRCLVQDTTAEIL